MLICKRNMRTICSTDSGSNALPMVSCYFVYSPYVNHQLLFRSFAQIHVPNGYFLKNKTLILHHPNAVVTLKDRQGHQHTTRGKAQYHTKFDIRDTMWEKIPTSRCSGPTSIISRSCKQNNLLCKCDNQILNGKKSHLLSRMCKPCPFLLPSYLLLRQVSIYYLLKLAGNCALCIYTQHRSACVCLCSLDKTVLYK